MFMIKEVISGGLTLLRLNNFLRLCCRVYVLLQKVVETAFANVKAFSYLVENDVIQECSISIFTYEFILQICWMNLLGR